MTTRKTGLYSIGGGKGKKKKSTKKKTSYYGSRGKNSDIEIKSEGISKAFIALSITLAVILALWMVLWFLMTNYKVNEVFVEGSTHYTDEEIKDIVMSGTFGDNSLYLSLKYHNRDIKDIPFVQTMSVKVLSPSSIRISVYEKALAGYAAHLGTYIYFDKDGIVVEASEQKSDNVPQVFGLEFDHVIMHEKLPVEDPQIFEEILDITQLMEKYDVFSDAIYFDKAGGLMLYYGEAKVSLGDRDKLDEKMMKLKPILPKIVDMKGTLRMDNYSEQMQNITFEKDE